MVQAEVKDSKETTDILAPDKKLFPPCNASPTFVNLKPKLYTHTFNKNSSEKEETPDGTGRSMCINL